MEKIVVDIAALVGISHLERFGQVLLAAGVRGRIVRSVDGRHQTRIVKHRKVGFTVCRHRLCLESQRESIGRAAVFGNIEADAAQLRAVVADRGQPLAHLRFQLGIELRGLAVGGDGLFDQAGSHRLHLFPCDHLAVPQVNSDVIIIQGFERIPGDGHLLDRIGLHTQRERHHHLLHADVQGLGRLGRGLQIGFSTADPGRSLRALLGIGRIGIAFLDLLKQRIFVYFLGSGPRSGKQQE